jgi:hypothetical protein
MIPRMQTAAGQRGGLRKKLFLKWAQSRPFAHDYRRHMSHVKKLYVCKRQKMDVHNRYERRRRTDTIQRRLNPPKHPPPLLSLNKPQRARGLTNDLPRHKIGTIS